MVTRPTADHKVLPIKIKSDRISRFGIERNPGIVYRQILADRMRQNKLALKTTVGINGNYRGIILTNDFISQVEDATIKTQSRVITVQITLQTNAVITKEIRTIAIIGFHSGYFRTSTDITLRLPMVESDKAGAIFTRRQLQRDSGAIATVQRIQYQPLSFLLTFSQVVQTVIQNNDRIMNTIHPVALCIVGKPISFYRFQERLVFLLGRN